MTGGDSNRSCHCPVQTKGLLIKIDIYRESSNAYCSSVPASCKCTSCGVPRHSGENSVSLTSASSRHLCRRWLSGIVSEPLQAPKKHIGTRLQRRVEEMVVSDCWNHFRLQAPLDASLVRYRSPKFCISHVKCAISPPSASIVQQVFARGSPADRHFHRRTSTQTACLPRPRTLRI